LASVLYMHGAVSAGASGAIFGILGAAIAEFALRRSAYPEAWRRGVLSNLVFLAIANVLIGSAVPGIDQAAHLGGLVTGGLVGALLAPRGRFGRTPFARMLAAALAFVGVLALAGTAVAVVETTTAATVDRIGWEHATFEGSAWTIDVPRMWSPVVLQVITSSESDETLIAEGLEDIAKKSEVSDARPTSPRFTSAGWTGEEHFAEVRGEGAHVRVRLACYVRRAHDGTRLRVSFALPESDLAGELPLVRRMLSSARAPE
jgi:hypothetical protein